MRKARRIASFLKLSNSEIEEVSHTNGIFDVVKFKIEEVSQNFCVLKLAGRHIDRQLQLPYYTTLHYTSLH